MEKKDLITIILIIIGMGLGLFLVLISNIDNEVIGITNTNEVIDK